MAINVTHDEATSASQDSQQNTGALLHRLVNDLATLFRQELALATAEMSRSISNLKTGVASTAFGGAVLYAGFLALLVAAGLGLARVLPGWLSALCIGVVVLAIGGLMLKSGAKQFSADSLRPKRTERSLRRDTDVLTRRFP